MSSSQLEDRQEAAFNAWVAEQLGLTPDELASLPWSIDANTGHDDAVYGHTVTFEEGADPTILAKIPGLNGSFVNIGFPPDRDDA